ncbi:UPF0223 family protein [Guptibacillus hwajinpoensis]|uniref:Uncharacterized protein YktA (UPF0223 family) n=2 Tax=Guptibacillus hwajinpoensis TaxID=208199 RepID=A0ABU0K051_9BACL|nr:MULTISPECIES: UPF0223 family protein [Alkalihalobacillus]KMM38818.1 hypothetical protein AB986_06025 [Alkalihalobacillus macyae]MDP4553161.1 UPF0223 family protein [Alkalihalobacillus macyae]MDQ0482731.1 uncharacterized protein YktA (UPF0223 family) [Alkalihalobacillus hemicentroti]
MEVQYPLSIEWSKEEVIKVVSFFQLIEKAYDNGVNKGQLVSAYHEFKDVVPSKSEEKQLFKQFDRETGYSTYHTVKEARETERDKVLMNK